MGCFSRIGCITILLVGGAIAWWRYGDRAPAAVSHASARVATRAVAAAAKAVQRLDTSSVPAHDTMAAWGVPADTRWVPLNTVGAAGLQSARAQVARFNARGGPAYLTLEPAPFIAVLAPALPAVLGDQLGDVRLALVDTRILIRASIPRRAIADVGALRAVLGTLLDGRDTVQLAATLEMQRPGDLRLQVREVRIHGVRVPSAVQGAVLNAVLPAAVRVEETGADATPTLRLAVPQAIGDVRLRDGRATLYRSLRP